MFAVLFYGVSFAGYRLYGRQGRREPGERLTGGCELRAQPGDILRGLCRHECAVRWCAHGVVPKTASRHRGRRRAPPERARRRAAPVRSLLNRAPLAGVGHADYGLGEILSSGRGDGGSVVGQLVSEPEDVREDAVFGYCLTCVCLPAGSIIVGLREDAGQRAADVSTRLARVGHYSACDRSDADAGAEAVAGVRHDVEHDLAAHPLLRDRPGNLLHRLGVSGVQHEQLRLSGSSFPAWMSGGCI